MPKVTVIIPAYNSEKTLIPTIDSVLNQSFKDFELIIINDGSIDKTEDIVKSYAIKDNRVKLLNQKNQGVSKARNNGIQNARGDYITFLDSDDFYSGTYLEKMYKKIKTSNCDVCYCGYNKFSPQKKTKVYTKFILKNILINYILGNIRVHTTGWMLKKEMLFLNDIKFNEDISWGEDFEFFCAILAITEKVTYVNEYLSNYRVEFDDNRLSDFSLDKIDKDFKTIMNLVHNPDVNIESSIEIALVEYRLNALIVYRLLTAIDRGHDLIEIKKIYKKYQNYLVKPKLNNKFRSIKLTISRKKLIKKMNSID